MQTELRFCVRLWYSKKVVIHGLICGALDRNKKSEQFQDPAAKAAGAA